MFYSLANLAGTRASHAARRAIRSVALAVVALFFLAIAVVFAAIAAFLWLATVMAPPLAGLCIAGVLLLVSILLLLLIRRPPAAAVGSKTASASLTSDMEAFGKRLGQNVNGYSLILGALALGVLLGSRRR